MLVCEHPANPRIRGILFTPLAHTVKVMAWKEKVSSDAIYCFHIHIHTFYTSPCHCSSLLLLPLTYILLLCFLFSNHNLPASQSCRPIPIHSTLHITVHAHNVRTRCQTKIIDIRSSLFTLVYQAPSTIPPLSKGTHGIIGRKDMNLLFQNIKVLLGSNRLLQHNLVHKLREPSIAHRQVSLVTANISPAVLHAPTDRFAMLVQVNTRKDHRVGHQGLAVDQSLSFGHIEADVEGQVILEYLGVQDTRVPLQVLAHIRAEPDLFHGLKELNKLNVSNAYMVASSQRVWCN